jgi:hypothetical protein
MVARRFADELTGPAWDRVRAVRRHVLGDDGLMLSDGAVPEALRHLLPYASLLSTGEEATLMAFGEAMGDEQRTKSRSENLAKSGAA